MIILGVDPGTRITGYGIIRSAPPSLEAIDYGCIRPPQKTEMHDRTLIIFEAITELIERFEPDVLAVETQYVAKNPQSALKLGMARGVIALAARRKGVVIAEYAPSKAKLAVTGSGKASKAQVVGMTQSLLKLAQPPTPEDAADALAIAICHAHMHSRPSSLVH